MRAEVQVRFRVKIVAPISDGKGKRTDREYRLQFAQERVRDRLRQAFGGAEILECEALHEDTDR